MTYLKSSAQRKVLQSLLLCMLGFLVFSAYQAFTALNAHDAVEGLVSRFTDLPARIKVANDHFDMIERSALQSAVLAWLLLIPLSIAAYHISLQIRPRKLSVALLGGAFVLLAVKYHIHVADFLSAGRLSLLAEAGNLMKDGVSSTDIRDQGWVFRFGGADAFEAIANLSNFIKFWAPEYAFAGVFLTVYAVLRQIAFGALGILLLVYLAAPRGRIDD
jgi:hypothetical protein